MLAAMDFGKLVRRAKKVVDDRGGTDALKDDLSELQKIAKSKESLADKAKDAGAAVKDPGAPGAEPREHRPAPAPKQPDRPA